MAAIVREVVGTAVAFDDDTASVTVGSGTQSTDLLVAFLGTSYADNVGQLTGPTGGGWTTVGAGARQGGGAAQRVWVKQATGGSQTITANYNTGGEDSLVVAVVAGADSVNASGYASGADGTPLVAPSVNAAGADELLLCGWVAGSYTGNLSLISPPGTMTAGGQTRDADNFLAASVGYQQLSASGATGTRTATVSGDYESGWIGASVTIVPAAAAEVDASAGHAAGTGTANDVAGSVQDPVLVDTYTVEATNAPATLTTELFQPRENELIVVKAVAGDEDVTIGVVSDSSGGDVFWYYGSDLTDANYTAIRTFVGEVGAAPAALTVTVEFTRAAGTAARGPTLIVERWAYAAIGDAESAIGPTTGEAPNVVSGVTTAGAVATWVVGDWLADAGTATYRAGNTENYTRQTGNIGVYSAYADPAAVAGNVSIGLTSPPEQRWRLAVLELHPGPPPVDVVNPAPPGHVFYLDISHFQGDDASGDPIDLQQVHDLGYAGCVAKIGQGAGLKDDGVTSFGATLDANWGDFRDEAVTLWPDTFAGYWYVGNTESAASQASRCAGAIGDTSIPVMLDWEDSGGDWSNLLSVLGAFRTAGLTVTMLYTPHAYGPAHGMADADTLGLSLVKARYWVTDEGVPLDLWEDQEAEAGAGWGFEAIGGLTPAAHQFTPAGLVYTGMAVDVNDFPGTAAELAAMMAGVPLPTTAAERYGWGTPLPSSDEFDYTGVPDPAKWGVYDGPGHAGNGTRDPDQVTVQDGYLRIAGNSTGDSGGMAHLFDQQYGRWECMARFGADTPGSGGESYHAVFIVWPTSELWPDDGEYDWLEIEDVEQTNVAGYLHYPHPEHEDGHVEQIELTGPAVDFTEWHAYAFEWVDGALRGYVDGEEWFSEDGSQTSSNGRRLDSMAGGHLTIQLDNFTGSSGLQPAYMDVEWARVYSLNGDLSPVSGSSSGSGDAVQPAAKVALNAGVPAGSGAALAPTVATAVSADAGSGVGSGAGYDAAVVTAVSAEAGSADGSGAALSPGVATAVSGAAGAAAGSAAAYDADVSTVKGAPAGVASGSGTAGDVAAGVSPVAVSAAGAGLGYDAAISTSVATAAGAAEGAGAAFDATSSSVQPDPVPNPGVGTGSAHTASASVVTTASSMSSSGTANQPDAGVAVAAGVAAGSGAAGGATVDFPTASPGAAVGSGTATVGRSSVSVQAVTASAAGTASGATVTAVAVTSPEPSTAAAAGSASSLAAAVAARAGVAAGSGAAHDAVGRPSVSAAAGAALASGAAHDAGVSLSASPTPATAAGSGAALAVTADVTLASPVLVDTYFVEALTSPATMQTESFLPREGEIIVVKAISGDETTVLGNPSGGGLTWTLRASSTENNYCQEKLFTAVVGENPDWMTVTLSTTGSQGSSPTLIVERWAYASLGASPVTNDDGVQTGTAGSGSPAGTPNVSLTPTDADSVLTWIASDWVPVSAASQPTVTYRGTASENYRRRDAAVNVWSAWQKSGSTSAQTMGLSSPTGQKWTLLALELLPGPAPVENPLVATDRLDQSFRASNGLEGTYHYFADGVDTSKPVGLMLWFHGDGAWEQDNPTDPYCFGGDRGVRAEARRRNMVLIAARTPRTDDTWWGASGANTAAQASLASANAVYARDLIQNVGLDGYDVDVDSIWLNGYSGGAQFVTQYLLPLYPGMFERGGGSVVFGGGGTPVGLVTPAAFSSTLKSGFLMHWCTGEEDIPANSDEDYGGLDEAELGEAYYDGQGFTTTLFAPENVDHDLICNQFGAVISDFLSRYVYEPGTYGGSNLVVTETFESGVGFTSGTWTRVTDLAYAGSASLRSPAVANGGHADAVFDVPAGALSVQFRFQTSTELAQTPTDGDFLRILIGDDDQEVQSGISPYGWQESMPYDVRGASTVTFRYQKDAGSTAAPNGTDQVWIDQLVFELPPNVDAPAGLATGSGGGLNAAGSAGGAAGASGGSGAVEAAGALVGAHAGVAAGAGRVPPVAVTPDPAAAPGVGTAAQASASVAPVAGHASATGAAAGAVAKVTGLGPAELAAGAAGALAGHPSVGARPAPASAVGSVGAPSTTVVLAGVEAAAGAGAAPALVPSLAGNPPAGAGAGSAGGPSTTVTFHAGHAAAGGSTGAAAAAAAVAGVAAGSGQVFDGAPAVAVPGGGLAGSGAVGAPSTAVTVHADAAAGSGAAASTTSLVFVPAGSAGGSGQAPDATAAVVVEAGAGSGAGSSTAAAPQVTVSAGSGPGAGSTPDAGGDPSGRPSAAAGAGAAGSPSTTVVFTSGAAPGSAAADAAHPEVSGAAGVAPGSGVAGQAAAAVDAAAQAPSGVGGAAAVAGVAVTVNVGAARGSGSAGQIGVSTSLSRTPDLASGSGGSWGPALEVSALPTVSPGAGTATAAHPSVSGRPAAAAGTAAVDTAAVAVRASAVAASGAGDADQVVPSAAVNAGTATGSGAAFGISVSTDVSRTPDPAVGSGTADGAARVSGRAAAAAGSGTTPQAVVDVDTSSSTAAATGAALNASVAVSALAGAATGAGAVGAVSVALDSNLGLSSGAATAVDASAAVDVVAGLAAGAGTALALSVSTDDGGAPPPAESAGVAGDASVHVTAVATAAAGAGTSGPVVGGVMPRPAEAPGVGAVHDPQPRVDTRPDTAAGSGSTAAGARCSVNAGVASGAGSADVGYAALFAAVEAALAEGAAWNPRGPDSWVRPWKVTAVRVADQHAATAVREDDQHAATAVRQDDQHAGLVG